jgi:2'-5' RNA ligase
LEHHRAVSEDTAMRLFAALVPPEVAIAEVMDVVRSVDPSMRELDPRPADRLHIPITGFGNVAQRDGETLLNALREKAAKWSPPKLRFAGSAALEFPGDTSVWARVDGDVDGLERVGRGVPPAVQRVGFLVDRRQFRPWLAVGDINDHTTAPYLEKLVGALDDFKGQPWTLEHLTVLRRVPTDVPGVVDEVVHEQIPLGE